MDTFSWLMLFAIIWIGLYVILRFFKTEKWGLNVKPFVLVYKTKALNKVMDKISRRGRLVWRVAWNIASALAVGQIIFIFYYLVKNAYFFFQQPEQASQVIPIVPGLTIGLDSLSYILISLVVVIITHEFAHGIASLGEKIPLKSSGIFLALVLPGGFVEIDEEKLEKARAITKLRIFSAGSSTNIAVGMFVLLLMSNFTLTISPFYIPDSSGVMITGLVEGGAAESMGMRKWDTILSLNGTSIKEVEDLREYMTNIKPDDKLTVTTKRGDFIINTQASPQDPDRALIGIIPFNYYHPRISSFPEDLPFQIYMTESWMNMILISVALLNMLPIGPLDGGRFTDTVLKIIKLKRAREIATFISIICILILGLNILLSFLNFGFRV